MTRKKLPVEIEGEIILLQLIRPALAIARPETSSGQSNLEALDVQITVLRERLGEEEIYDRWNDGYLLNVALGANAWMNGADLWYGGPAEGWKILLVPGRSV